MNSFMRNWFGLLISDFKWGSKTVLPALLFMLAIVLFVVSIGFLANAIGYGFFHLIENSQFAITTFSEELPTLMSLEYAGPTIVLIIGLFFIFVIIYYIFKAISNSVKYFKELNIRAKKF